MNNQEQINLIREKCIASNPEIVELKFGCEVDRGAGVEAKEIVCGYFDDQIALMRSHPNVGDFLPFEVPKDLVPTWTILGRTIRLADVLLAIEEKDNDKIYISSAGELFDVDADGDWFPTRK